MKYSHKKNNMVLELVKKTETYVVLKDPKTNIEKKVSIPTFKRWWQLVKDEAETQGVPVEPQNDHTEPEASKPDETLTDDKKASTEAQNEPLVLSDVVRELESLFDILNRLYFEDKLPKPVITIQTTPRAYGHCSVKKIWRPNAENESEGQYEINIGAEYINRPSERTATTMLHEMIHLYCRENDIDETCQGGRYHNKKFKAECEARDLIVDYDYANGYTHTSPSDVFTEKLVANNFALNTLFARRTVEQVRTGSGKEPKDGSGKKLVRNKARKYVCPVCGQTVKSTQLLNLICGICEEKMPCVE